MCSSSCCCRSINSINSTNSMALQQHRRECRSHGPVNGCSMAYSGLTIGASHLCSLANYAEIMHVKHNQSMAVSRSLSNAGNWLNLQTGDLLRAVLGVCQSPQPEQLASIITTSRSSTGYFHTSYNFQRHPWHHQDCCRGICGSSYPSWHHLVPFLGTRSSLLLDTPMHLPQLYNGV